MSISEPIDAPLWAWLVFGGIVFVSLALDLWVHRDGRGLSRKQAIAWSVAWIGVALLFAAGLGLKFGRGAATEFVTAYAIEKSLSVDNLFLFIVIFGRLKIPEAEQHRVLFWGILGAFAARALHRRGHGAAGRLAPRGVRPRRVPALHRHQDRPRARRRGR
ncbi:MAG TPA: hypothetical protein VFS43_04170 [Polyangiaceae bacterium]|nr:hypothetical protein [Polyangiaceae bacterium]